MVMELDRLRPVRHGAIYGRHLTAYIGVACAVAPGRGKSPKNNAVLGQRSLALGIEVDHVKQRMPGQLPINACLKFCPVPQLKRQALPGVNTRVRWRCCPHVVSPLCESPSLAYTHLRERFEPLFLQPIRFCSSPALALAKLTFSFVVCAQES